VGLDDFKKDEGKQHDQDEKQDQESETSPDSTGSSTNEEEPSGLEAFMEPHTATPDGDDGGSGSEEEDTSGEMFAEVAGMSKNGEVQHIRENYFPDYYPECQQSDEWSYNEVIELNCICENVFTFTTRGVCLECGRAYKRQGRTVKQISGPEVDD
jgi:hypothetical protein